MAEVTAGPALAVPGLAGDADQRVCKRPGCGNLVPLAGRGRTRLFCCDGCSRRFHNAAGPPMAALRCRRSRPVIRSARWRR